MKWLRKIFGALNDGPSNRTATAKIVGIRVIRANGSVEVIRKPKD